MKIKEKAVRIPSSSMADIAFLLLIFFLLTTTIDMEKGLRMILPDPEPIPISPENIETIIINSENELSYEDEMIELNAINLLVRDHVIKNPNLIIEIRSSKLSDYNQYIAVLDQVKQAEAKKISVQIE